MTLFCFNEDKVVQIRWNVESSHGLLRPTDLSEIKMRSNVDVSERMMNICGIIHFLSSMFIPAIDILSHFSTGLGLLRYFSAS